MQTKFVIFWPNSIAVHSQNFSVGTLDCPVNICALDINFVSLRSWIYQLVKFAISHPVVSAKEVPLAHALCSQLASRYREAIDWLTYTL